LCRVRRRRDQAAFTGEFAAGFVVVVAAVDFDLFDVTTSSSRHINLFAFDDDATELLLQVSFLTLTPLPLYHAT
jgi:hypothetical protein